MIHGVRINDVNTLDTYGLMLLANITYGAPPMKSNRLDISWADGSMDCSYFTGQPTYGDRKLKFTLFAPVTDYELEEIRSKIMADFHGQIVNLILPNNPTMYYRGTVEFGDLSGYNSGKIPVTMTAEPWKYSVHETVVTQGGNGVALLENLRMPVTPRITATAAATLTWPGHSVAIETPGSDLIVPALTLGAGATEVTVDTTGIVTFTYRQGGF